MIKYLRHIKIQYNVDNDNDLLLFIVFLSVLIGYNLNETFKTRINPSFFKIVGKYNKEDKNTCHL